MSNLNIPVTVICGDCGKEVVSRTLALDILSYVVVEPCANCMSMEYERGKRDAAVSDSDPKPLV